MAALLRGEVEVPAYAALLHNLHAIYAVLEPALQRRSHLPALASIDWSALARAPSLLDDLRQLAAVARPGPSAPLALEPAAARYVLRLQTIEAADPELLLAHAYVRYLGDLSGGQILRRIVAGSRRLPPDVGTAFYDFGDSAVTAALTRAFRDGLERAVVANQAAVVAEAKLSFEYHQQLFDELAMRWPVEA